MGERTTILESAGAIHETPGWWWIWPEDMPSMAVRIFADGALGATCVASDLWPDGDPWCAARRPPTVGLEVSDG